MASYNKIILVGNLTRDPQLSYLPSQTPVCEIGLAVNHRWKGQDGQQREDVCFIDCRCYGRQAEILNQYAAKGQQILVEGRLDYDRWESQDGQKRSKHRVFITGFQFLGGGQAKGGPQQGADSYAPSATPHAPKQDDFVAPPDDAISGPDGEDIPF